MMTPDFCEMFSPSFWNSPAAATVAAGAYLPQGHDHCGDDVSLTRLLVGNRRLHVQQHQNALLKLHSSEEQRTFADLRTQREVSQAQGHTGSQ